MALAVGSIIQRRYCLIRQLGSGGMGTTYLAEDLVRRTVVALKLVHEGDALLLDAFKAEFELLRGLFHPHLGRVLDFGPTRSDSGRATAFYTSVLVRGVPLDEFAARNPLSAALLPVADAVCALDFLHDLGVRHGDFKPGNILVDEHGFGVLIDLGCSQPFGAITAVSGTPGFVAPEVFEGRADRRADLFSVGRTLETLLRRGGVAPPSLDRLVARLCSANPADRPNDAREVLEALGLRAATHATPGAVPPVLLARDREVGRFRTALEALLAREPGPRGLVVHGPDGVGRTRLLQEMKWLAQLRCAVVEGHAGQLAPVRSILERATGADLPAPGLSGVLFAREELARRGEPVVLMLDDADHLEPAERDLWQGLLRSLAPSDPVLVVASQRLVPEASPGLEPVPLAPLGLEAVRSWTERALSSGRAEDVLALTGGFPAALRDVVSLSSSGSGAHALDAGALSLSDRRRAAFRALDAADRLVLGAAAVDGGELDPRDLAGLDAGAEALGRLGSAGWIAFGEIGFRLARRSEAASIRELLEPAERADLHRAAAARIRARLLEPTTPRASESALRGDLVRHLCACGKATEAQAELAAAKPLQEAHPRAFCEAARAVAELVGDPGALLAAAEVHEAAGRPADALSLLAAVLRARPGAAVRARVDRLAGAAYLAAGDARRAARRFERALARPATMSPDDRARLADLSSRALIKQGAWADAFARANEGLALTDRADLRADLFDDLGVAASYLGELDRARAFLRDAAALHALAGRPRAEAKSASYLALAAYRAGDARAAADGFRRALVIAEAEGAADLEANAALNLATASHQLGDLGEALSSYERALRLAVALGKATTEATLRVNLAKLHVDVGMFERGAAGAEEAERRATELGMALVAAAARAVLGEASLARGDAPRAIACFEHAKGRFAELGARRELAEVLAQLAEALLSARRPGPASEALEGAQRAAAELDAGDVAVRAELVRGALALARGRAAEATVCLEAAAKRAAGTDQRALEAEALARLSDADRALGSDLRARRRAEEACEIWETMAATLPAHFTDAFWAHPLRKGRREAFLAPPAPTTEASARERQLERLLDINKKLNSSLDVDTILRWTVDSALELTGAERGFVLLAGEGDRPLGIALARNLEAEVGEAAAGGFSRGIAERVVATGEPVTTVDAQGDQRFAEHASVHAMRLKSVLCAPIRSREGVVGALYVDHRFQRGLFQARDVELVLAFADQVALALTNARLHRDLERRTRELLAERQRIELLLQGQVEQIDRLTEEVRLKQEALEHRYDYGAIVGKSPPMQALFATLDRVIDTPATVLIEGESGTGKELIARAIHFNGPRKEGPFVAINCGALPEQLLESELFGSVRGAFTGASRDRAGLFVAADGGTLFLDELGEMPPGMQVKLLRVVQQREVVPVGSNAAVPVDVRLVAATNRRMRERVEKGLFREDLYYRLAVVELRLPPLRDRAQDIPALAARIVEEAARSFSRPAPAIGPAAMRALLEHTWPGNVRELENVLTKAVLMSAGDVLGPADLELPAQASRQLGPASRGEFADQEGARILGVLRATRWNVAEASRTLGIPRATLYRKLGRLGASRP